MKRRNFIKKNAILAAAPFITSGLIAKTISNRIIAERPFKLNYAPHFGMFNNNAGEDLLDQLQFMHDQGFRSLEDNGMKGRSKKIQNAIAKKMSRLNMDMGVFVGHKIYWKEPNLASGDKSLQDEFVNHIKESVEVAKRVNAKWMTVVPGHVDLKKEMAYQTVNVVEALRRACDVLEPNNLVMVLEPLNWWSNHAGQFLTEIPQTYEICRAVNSRSCKILFDIYHQQISEGNLISNMNKSWEEIAYFQIGDNPGRKEPTTGEINYLNVFKHIHSKGYKDILGMEHGNSIKGKEGEIEVIKSYRKVDAF
ncbi:MAG: xylose isomerase [Candidatus Marinimicrobia bacterium]|nr:xylose isomerase [Candidatus Neomarinimicrobiota bacterium]|tara:strand:+ start:13558 stop:14481 length:924 start_codon:yes stop_codon:yes gene_type:complete